MSASTEKLFIGIMGTVVALDRTTGTELWRTKLKGGDFVNILVEGAMSSPRREGNFSVLRGRAAPSAGKIL